MQPLAERKARQKTRQENARATREALLRAALKVVARHGYARASVSRITEAAGVAQGTLYSYFDSHQQLLDELLPAEGVKMLNVLARSGHGSQNYFEHEKRTCMALLAYVSRKPSFLRILTEAEIAAPQSHAQHMRNIEDRYLGALHRAQLAGEIRPQSDKAFRVIAEVLSGSRGYIALGLRGREGERNGVAPLSDWASDVYVKFLRFGLADGGRFASGAAPPARKAAPKPADTRSLLFEATARVIHRGGYGDATVLSITEEAGVAVGTFYTHFRSRQEHFEDLLDYVRASMLAHVKEAVRGSGTFAELECRGFDAFFDYLADNPWFIRIETEAAVWAPAAFRRHFFDFADRYVAALRRSRAAGELGLFEDRDLPILAYVLMAARHYLATRYVLPKGAPRRLPAYIGETYAELIFRGLAEGRGDDRALPARGGHGRGGRGRD